MKRYRKTGIILPTEKKTIAREARFVIVAESEGRAAELIEQEGEDPDNYTLNEIGAAKDELGRYFPESIRDARI